MRVVICTETVFPLYGVERRVYEMAKRLPEYGIDVNVYTSLNFSQKNMIKVSNPTIINPPKRNYAFCIQYLINTFRKLERSNYDIIDANGHLSIIPSSIAGIVKKTPVITTIHDLYLNDWKTMYSGNARIIGKYFENFIVKIPYAKMITLNSTLKKKLIGLGVDRKKLHIIYSGIDTKEIDKIGCDKKTTNRIIYIGRLVPQKNVGLLIRACARINHAFELRIIGDGLEMEKLKLLAKKCGIERKTTFIGSLKSHDDVIREMKQAAILVLPSYRECFGIVPLEAMRCKTAVISTNTEGPRDFIHHGKNGYLTRIDDIDDMAKKIDDILENKQLLHKFKINGFKTAGRFDWDVLIKQIVALYEDTV